MPVFEFQCNCGKRFSDLVGMVSDSSTKCPACGATEGHHKLVSRATFKIPAHMTDEGIETTRKQREWLRTPEARAMDLQRSSGSDEVHPKEPELESLLEHNADEMFHDFVKGGMPADASREEIADRAGIDLADDPLYDLPQFQEQT